MPPIERYVRQGVRSIGLDRVGRYANRGKLLICCYHGVRDDDDPIRHWLMLSRAAFVRQMLHLRDHYECLPLRDALRALRAGALTQPTACVTFDDGYLNNRTIAYPVLEELGIPATIYVTTGLLDARRALWTTHLELALVQGPTRTIRLDVLGLGEATAGIPEAATLARALVERLKLLPANERASALGAIEAQCDEPVIPDTFEFMTWSDVDVLANSGLVDIGAHTVSHEIVSRLSADALELEIGQSVASISARTGRSVESFAYPNGRAIDFDGRSRAVLQRLGCESAVSTIEGLNARGADPFALRRVVVGGADSHDAFVLRCAGLSRANLVGRLMPAVSPEQ
jgi:peptidoglycan/xylan/chitin deacetylase (PgdA/CDA1 family)